MGKNKTLLSTPHGVSTYAGLLRLDPWGVEYILSLLGCQTGVFPLAAEWPSRGELEIDPEGKRRQIDRLRRLREERDNEKVDARLAWFKDCG